MENCIKAKLFGMLLGDGWISVGQNQYGSTYYQCGFSGDPQALIRVQNDLITVFPKYQPTNIYQYNTESPKYGIKGTTTSFNCPVSIAKEFIALGMPTGKRVEKEFILPEWITNGSNEIKIAFLSGLYAAEGYTPAMQKNDKTLKVLGFTLTKRKALEDNLTQLINQLSFMLQDVGIKHSMKLKETRTCDDNIRVDFIINNSQENLYHFFNQMDLRYAQEKYERAQLLKQYYQYRQNILDRFKLGKQEAMKPNASLKEIAEKYNVSYRQVQHWRYDNRGVQVPKSTMTLTEFKEHLSVTRET